MVQYIVYLHCTLFYMKEWRPGKKRRGAQEIERCTGGKSMLPATLPIKRNREDGSKGKGEEERAWLSSALLLVCISSALLPSASLALLCSSSSYTCSIKSPAYVFGPLPSYVTVLVVCGASVRCSSLPLFCSLGHVTCCTSMFSIYVHGFASRLMRLGVVTC